MIFREVRNRLGKDLKDPDQIPRWFSSRGIDYDEFKEFAQQVGKRSHTKAGIFCYGVMLGWELLAERMSENDK
jgi:hypothetical protein